MKPISIVGILFGATGLFVAYTINERIVRFVEGMLKILPRESVYKENFMKIAIKELDAVQIYFPWMVAIISLFTIYISIKSNAEGK